MEEMKSQRAQLEQVAREWLQQHGLLPQSTIVEQEGKVSRATGKTLSVLSHVRIEALVTLLTAQRAAVLEEVENTNRKGGNHDT